MSTERVAEQALRDPASSPSGEASAVDTCSRRQDFYIVGVGASAGGLDSLERLFTHLPADTGMAFVVLQHLSPDLKSLMDELLARRTDERAEILAHADSSGPTALVPPFADVPGARLELDVPHETTAVGVLSRDEQQALEDELAHTKEHLQTAVREQETANEELQAANEELIAANEELQSINEQLHSGEEEIHEGVRRREQFLAMLSHELRNPLAAILAAMRVLDNAQWTDDACHEAGQVVARQAHHMSRLLDDLLDVARITRGRIALRTEMVDLRQTARSAIEALGPFMAERSTTLSLGIDAEPVYVMGDAARLQQVQANLLSNASKYSPATAPVRFELRKEDGLAMIRVTDEGRGIEPEMLPRIFDLFVQGDQPLARPEGGLGIGLTLLRSLVELHHGRVEAHSEGPGRGSVFTVWLPLAPSAVVNAQAGRGATCAPVRSVVLVEDQADARRMLQLLLESAGVLVYTAGDGEAGAGLIERTHPDLALVDLGLPVMNGFDLARRIRANAENAGTRLVALSGYGQDADVQASLDAGFDEHLTKPPDAGRLERLLQGSLLA